MLGRKEKTTLDRPVGNNFKSKETKVFWAFLTPYVLVFITFIIIPVVSAMLLSLSNFDSVQFPSFVGFQNYVTLITQDPIFLQYVLPNTIRFSLIVGPVGYALSFFLAWMLAQIPKLPRTIYALIVYSPSMVQGVAMSVMWRVIFSGAETGYLNNLMLRFGLIETPIQFLQSPQYLMPIMIIVTLWSSMGVGFLSMLAGVLNVDVQLYEAGYIDGVSNRFQEIIYITIPSMRPQMLFGAVMAVVNTFQAGAIGVELSGQNPTPQNAGQLIVNHIEDYGFIRYEMGYASAVSVVLLLLVWMSSRFVNRVLTDE